MPLTIVQCTEVWNICFYVAPKKHALLTLKALDEVIQQRKEKINNR